MTNCKSCKLNSDNELICKLCTSAEYTGDNCAFSGTSCDGSDDAKSTKWLNTLYEKCSTCPLHCSKCVA